MFTSPSGKFWFSLFSTLPYSESQTGRLLCSRKQETSGGTIRAHLMMKSTIMTFILKCYLWKIALTYWLLSDLENPTIHPVNITPHSFRVAVVRVEENPVPPQEFLKCVADRKSQFPDADSVQHAGVPQLTHAQLSVEHLEEVTATVKAPSTWSWGAATCFNASAAVFFLLVKICNYWNNVK